VSWAGIASSTTKVVGSSDLFIVGKRTGPVPKKNKSDNSRSETEMTEEKSQQTTVLSDEKRDEIEELYTEYGGEG
jgi:hypothetical protein